jgi:exodeoxyribonuclease V beta subunit
MPLGTVDNDNANQAFNQEDLIEWLTQVIDAPFIQTCNANSEAKPEISSEISPEISPEINLDEKGTEKLASLSDLPLGKTLRESEFYFPMEGEGTDALAKLLTDHRNGAERSDNNSSRFSVMLPNYKKLSGMMHGFIDLIFEHQGKYYLCDYKSSHLGDSYQDYQFDALLDNVEKNYYDLQYLIYSLALHRYLKQTLVGYDVNQHFGGAYYLYLRGMTTDPQYQGAGVYYRNISALEINQLDALFSAKNTEQQSTEEDA